jgi:hypothetical protein
MAAEATIKLLLEMTGLGDDLFAAGKFSTTTTPTKVVYNYKQQATADTAEVLALGGVTTPHLLVIHCITNDLSVDTSYSATFSAEVSVQEGEFAVLKPSGTLWIKNEDSAEQSTFEYWVIGV